MAKAKDIIKAPINRNQREFYSASSSVETAFNRGRVVLRRLFSQLLNEETPCGAAQLAAIIVACEFGQQSDGTGHSDAN